MTHRSGMLRRMLGRMVFLLWIGILPLRADPVPVRVVSANLTSDRYQAYSPDNGNHSNPEGAGARILQALQPDVVLIQEFNTTQPVRQWINQTFGQGYSFFREESEEPGNFIPNGIISRHPIVAAGEWPDAAMPNRDFVWARIRLPNGRDLWAVSVHLSAKSPALRARQAEALRTLIAEHIPAADPVVLGGDFNTRSREEPALAILRPQFPVPRDYPPDQDGNENTNARRSSPYDWVLADAELAPAMVPVRLADEEFPGGLVFDSRTFRPLDAVPPVQPGDSGVPHMQHMAVVCDFVVR